jgi:hypothetical protein
MAKQTLGYVGSWWRCGLLVSAKNGILRLEGAKPQNSEANPTRAETKVVSVEES